MIATSVIFDHIGVLSVKNMISLNSINYWVGKLTCQTFFRTSVKKTDVLSTTAEPVTKRMFISRPLKLFINKWKQPYWNGRIYNNSFHTRSSVTSQEIYRFRVGNNKGVERCIVFLYKGLGSTKTLNPCHVYMLSWKCLPIISKKQNMK